MGEIRTGLVYALLSSSEDACGFCNGTTLHPPGAVCNCRSTGNRLVLSCFVSKPPEILLYYHSPAFSLSFSGFCRL